MEPAEDPAEAEFKTAVAEVANEEEKKVIIEAHGRIPEMRTLRDTAAWEGEEMVNGAVHHLTKVPGFAGVTRRFVQECDVSAEKFAGAMKDPTIRLKDKDANVKEVEVKGEISLGCILYYMRMKAGMMMDDRDFCQVLHTFKQSDGTFVVVDASVEHSSVPAVKKCVRGDMTQVFFVEPIDEGNCRVTRVVRADPKGNVPNAMKGKVGKNNSIPKVLELAKAS